MTYPTPIPAPTPECAAFETLLPLLDTDALTPDEAATTRRHIADCRWCQAQRTSYHAFEAALRRHYSSDVSSITLEGIMRADGDDKAGEVLEDDASQLVLEISSIAPTTPRTPRKRWRFAEIAAVVVVGLLAATLLVDRTGLLSGLPFNRAPLTSSAGAVVFTRSVPWGKLQLNGQTIAVAIDGHHPLYLPRGENTLTYSVSPLPALTCTMSAPAARSDTCPIYSGDENETNSGNSTQFAGRIVDLRATPDRLSATQRDALTTAIQQQLDTLDATVTIQPGDHYATPEGQFLTSYRTFTMTLKSSATSDGIGVVSYGCVPFCKNVPGNVWTISPAFRWEYVDQYGKLETVLQGPAGYSSQSDIDLGMQLRWNGAWRVSFPDATISSATCSLVSDIMENRLLNSGYQGGFGMGCGGNPLTTTYIGTLVDLNMPNSASGGSEKSGRVLYRGGALIAADSIAHDLAPWMPIASAHEQAIVRQLLGLNS